MSEVVYCTVCGVEIPRSPRQSLGSYLLRRVCPPQLDQKDVSCFIQYRRKPNGDFEAKSGRKKAEKATASEKPVLTEAEERRLDREQMRINLECHRRDIERCGYSFSYARSLSAEEIAAVAHLYEPPRVSGFTVTPHFREERF